VNVDRRPHEGVTVVADGEYPLPFADESFGIVWASHVVEHVHNYTQLMREFHRILVPRGVLHVVVPEFPCGASIADPTHVRYFVPQSFFHLTGEEIGFRTEDSLEGLFDIGWLEVVPHPNPAQDRGQAGWWNREIHCELIKRAPFFEVLDELDEVLEEANEQSGEQAPADTADGEGGDG
jgi:SAM-dependent methyltransferase